MSGAALLPPVAPRWRRLALLDLGLAAVVALSAACGLPPRPPGPLRLIVSDAHSGEPVYGAHVVSGERVALLFRGHDAQITPDARAGRQLQVSAPGYEEQSVAVDVGATEPLVIRLAGREIAGLGGILVWPRSEGGAIVFDVQLRNAAGANIEFFPGLPLPAELRLFENGGSADAPVRGALLYEGRVAAVRHADASFAKLSYTVAFAAIAARRSARGAGIVDFTLVAPNGRFSMSRADVELPVFAGKVP
jgi:hypothetical protein